MAGGREAETIISLGQRWAGAQISPEGGVMFHGFFPAFSCESPASLGGCFLQFLQLPDLLGSLLISPGVGIPSFAEVPWSTYDVVICDRKYIFVLCPDL